MSKDKNYDYTGKGRMENREQRIRDAGLSNLKIVMHKDDDATEVRELAETL